MQEAIATPDSRVADAKAPLAARQRQLIDAIERMSQAAGFPPSQRELAAELGLSLARVSQLVTRCEADGLISRKSKNARTCRIVQPTRCGRQA